MILNPPDLEPADFNDGFADQISNFIISATNVLGIVLDIKLEPLSINLKNVNFAQEKGTFLCQIKCLN